MFSTRDVRCIFFTRTPTVKAPTGNEFARLERRSSTDAERDRSPLAAGRGCQPRRPKDRSRCGTEVNSRQGFTLIELLVTVTVIGVLAALMLPALGSAKQKARGIICLNHLRQWGLATQLYVNDHDDFLPPEGTPNPGERSTNSGWYIQLPRTLDLPRYHAMPWRTNAEAPVTATVWLCPSNRRRSNGRNLFHYCLNAHVNGTGEANRPVRHASIPGPSAVVWLFDSKNLPAVGYWGYSHTNLHSGGANFTFLDGHARRFRKAEYWDDETNKGRNDNPEIRWVP